MQPPRKRFAIDPLETRRLLATFSGTSGADTIDITTLSFFHRVIINGVVNTTSDATVTINALGGNDVISVTDTLSASNVTVNGGDGNDRFQNTVNDLDAVYDNFVFNGGTGTDTVLADNGADDANGRVFHIRGNRIIKNGQFINDPAEVLLDYSQIESLVFADNNNGNVLIFSELQGPGFNVANATILGHGGDDAIHNNAALQPILGTSIGTGGLHADGGPGTDTFQLNDRGDTSSATFTINSTSVDAITSPHRAGRFTHANCEKGSVIGSSAANVVNVNSKLSAMSLGVTGGAGNDTFVVGGGDLDSNGFVLSNTGVGGGDGGFDSVRFDDRLDAEGETETYTWREVDPFSQLELSKGSAGVRYNGFETAVLDSGGAVNAINTPNTIDIVDLENLNHALTSLTINATGTLRSTFINVTANSLGTTARTLTFNAPGAALNVNDATPTGVIYEATQTQLRKPSAGLTINPNGVTQAALNTSAAADTVRVFGTPAGMAFTVNGSNGDDTFSVGSGNVSADLLGPVTLNGGSGADFAFIDNSTDAAVATQTLNGATFVDGRSHTFSSLDGLKITGGPGGTNFTVNASAFVTDIFGGSGDDTFTIGGGDINSNLLANDPTGLFVDGQGGDDGVIFNDLNDATLDQYVCQRFGGNFDQLVKDGTTDVFVVIDGMEAATLEASNAPSAPQEPCVIAVVDWVTPLRINGNAGSDRVTVADAAAPVAVHTGLGDADSLVVNSDFAAGDAPVTVVIEQGDDVETLDVKPGGTVRVAAGAVLTKTRLNSPPGLLSIAGVLDLAGGSFLSTAGGPSLEAFRAHLLDGFNSGTWNGTSNTGAINSSLASASPALDGVGYGLGSQVAISTIGPFIIAPGDTLLTHALYGDGNLDGRVNLADFNRLAGSFGQSNKSWTDGDSNYDGSVNLADFNALAGNFGSSAREAASAAGITRTTGTDLRELLKELT